MRPYFVSQKDGVDSIIYIQQVCLVLNAEILSNCTAKIKFPKQWTVKFIFFRDPAHEVIHNHTDYLQGSQAFVV